MKLPTSSAGRQVVMAVSGFFLLLFVVGHMLGNLTLFGGPGAINSYAAKLHSLGPLLWAERLFMLAMLVIHVYFGIVLTLENRASKPDRSARQRWLRATFAGRSVIWTGLLLLAFIVYHLLHFTFHVTPGVVTSVDAAGRFNVHAMVVNAFRSVPVSVVYVAAMVMLLLHVSHGAQSFLQTVGWNNERTLPRVEKAAKWLAWILLVGFSAIPIAILARR